MRSNRNQGYPVSLILATILLTMAGTVLALSIPPYQQTSPGGDEVRARDGTTCRMGQHPTPVLDFGGSAGNGNQAFMQPFGAQQQQGMNGEVYGRIVIPLDITPISRVDCSRLYDLEVERLQIEIEQLKKGAEGGVQVE